LEDRNKLPEEQAGFRKDRCTLEQAFILQEILDSRKAHKATYACFIDLTNAFGSTWQDGMWYQLRATGVKGKLYRSIRSLYNQCKSAILSPFGLTNWFTSGLGTRQGAVSSPLSFSLLVNPLANLLKSQGFGVHLGDKHIACLLYADDLVLIANFEAQLCDMLETATQFFRQWRFTVVNESCKLLHLAPAKRSLLETEEASQLETSNTINTLASYLKKGAVGTACKHLTLTKPSMITNSSTKSASGMPDFRLVSRPFCGLC
jgi:hypothetical protein